jgi:hypothetical protein
VSDNLYAYAGDNPVSVTDPSWHAPSSGPGAGGITAGQVAAANRSSPWFQGKVPQQT